VDPLFVGATRPPMRFGVTYAALLVNAAFTMEVFILTKNPLVLLIALPIHGVCVLLCARDPRCFDLLFLWCRTRLLAHLTTWRYWKGASYSPLALSLPGRNGRRQP
jgi:type IV secretion system protein VirB3